MPARKRLGLGLWFVFGILLDDFIDAWKEVIGSALADVVKDLVACAGLEMSQARAALLILLVAWLAVLVARGIRGPARPEAMAPSTSQPKGSTWRKTVFWHLLRELRRAEECTLSQEQLVECLCHGQGCGATELKEALEFCDDFGWIEQRRVVVILGARPKCEVRLTASGRCAWAKMRAPGLACLVEASSSIVAVPGGAALAKRALKRRPPRRPPCHRRGAPAVRSGSPPSTQPSVGGGDSIN